MIFSVVAFYLTYSRLSNVNEIRLFAIIVGFASVLFLGMGELRIGAINSSISTLEYLKIYSDVAEALPVNTFEVTFNLYTSLNFNTFNNIVHELDSIYFGAYTFRPILDITKINNIFGTGIPESRDTVKMLATIIADPYLDLGLLGVFIFAFSYGIFGSYSYSAYKTRANAAYILLWATFAFVMVMAVFTNFFNLFFIWLCIGLFLIMLFQPGRK
jgi:oligosaccharide repeat unit polymerase